VTVDTSALSFHEGQGFLPIHQKQQMAQSSAKPEEQKKPSYTGVKIKWERDQKKKSRNQRRVIRKDRPGGTFTRCSHVRGVGREYGVKRGGAGGGPL